MHRPGSPHIERLPFRGAPTTAQAIVKAARDARDHYVLRQLAEHVTRHLDAKDYLSEALAIYHYVLAHTRYMRDPRGIELVKAPHVLAREILDGGRPQIDCDEMAALILALLDASGARARIVALAFNHLFHRGERQYSHIVVQFQEPHTGVWVTLDPVANSRTRNMLKRAVAVKVWPFN